MVGLQGRGKLAKPNAKHQTIGLSILLMTHCMFGVSDSIFTFSFASASRIDARLELIWRKVLVSILCQWLRNTGCFARRYQHPSSPLEAIRPSFYQDGKPRSHRPSKIRAAKLSQVRRVTQTNQLSLVGSSLKVHVALLTARKPRYYPTHTEFAHSAFNQFPVAELKILPKFQFPPFGKDLQRDTKNSWFSILY